ncbi:MAG: LacI family transcriptional regulator [Anaerolineae bacterium]|nr:LacI family transcriptional regulator [Anaerolineae bacterium]
MSGNHNGKVVTQDDVAHHAGVSRSIVSYVINNGPRKVSEETRNRVLVAIKELGYRPNKHAQMLSATVDNFAEKYIGIVLAANYMFKRPYYGSILASMHECAHEQDWHIRFIRLFDDFSNPALFNELIHPNEISGVILLGLDQVLSTPEDYALVEQIVERVERVVCVEWEWPGIPSVQFDRQNAAYQSTHHLLISPNIHIAYIGPNDKRIQGYQQALWEKGLHPDERYVHFAIDSRSGYDCCEQLIQSGVKLDAICAGTDEVAVGILHCLHKYNLQVPDDVAVASIDNLDISAFTIPALTTVDVPKQEIGFHAVETLISNDPRKNASAFAITVHTELVVRESSGAVAG